ncbi:hypothetical protein [Amycolatopsis thailandensis]|uniref:hypothetical protein n=1 Tax=Amycolatopsis thailandensis TaxID=589330 RepID=UPI001178805A|nr:hypothetical protein [Amycolatopsis thailandensis]
MIDEARPNPEQPENRQAAEIGRNFSDGNPGNRLTQRPRPKAPRAETTLDRFHQAVSVTGRLPGSRSNGNSITVFPSRSAFSRRQWRTYGAGILSTKEGIP